MRSPWLCLLAFVALFVGGGLAHAQPNDAAAHTLLEEGRNLMTEGKTLEACSKFEASQKLVAQASTALSLADCYEKLTRIASAWSAYGTALTLAEREGNTERADYAKGKLAEMEAKLARVTISVGSALQGLEVTLDDTPVLPAMFGTPLPIDPGEHVLGATAPAKKPWRQTFTVPAEKALIPLTVGVLEDDVAHIQVPDAPPEPAPQPLPAPESRGSTSPLVYVGFSLAGAGVLLGAITGIVAIAQTSSIRDNCPDDRCPTSQSEAVDDAELIANVSNVGFAAAGVGVVLGVVGLLVPSDVEPGAARIEPLLGPDFVGLRGRF